MMFLLYLIYGAAFVYHMNMKNMFEDDMTEFDAGTIFAVAVIVLSWPVWIFLLVNEAADLKDKVDMLTARILNDDND